MNEVIRSAAEQTDHSWLLGLGLVIFMVIFGAYTLWIFLPGNKEYLEEASQIPFDDDDEYGDATHGSHGI